MANPEQRAYLDSLHPHPDFPPIQFAPPSHPQQSPHHSNYNQAAATMSIQAQSDEIKYQGKYKELKRKVKDIELDNDKLQVKVLKVKKQIERLRLERAILYERLMTLANTPSGSTQAVHPPGVQATSGPPPPGMVPENFYTVVGQNNHNPMTPAGATVVTAQYQQKAQTGPGPGPGQSGQFGSESHARMPQSHERERVERDQERYYREGVHGHRSDGHTRGHDHPVPPNMR